MVRLLLGLPLADAAAEHIFDTREAATAPDLINAEVVHTIRRYEHLGEISPERAAEAIEDLLALPVVRYPTLQLVERAWQLRRNFTAYDALYVALSEALDAPLVTADGALASAAQQHADVAVVRLQ